MWPHHNTANPAPSASAPEHRPQRHGERVRDERPVDLAVRRDLEDLRQQLGRDHAADHREDQERVTVEGQALGLGHEAAQERPADRDEDDDRDDVLHRAHERPQQAVERDRDDGLDDPAGHDVGGPDREQHEAPEDAGVHQPGPGVLEHLRLHERVADQPDEPGRDVRERTRPAGAHRREHAQVAGHGEAEERGRAPEDREDQQVRRDVGERLEHGQAVVPWSNGPARVSSA